VTNFKQDSVLPSIPIPTGHEIKDRSYSPLWQVHRVTWVAGAKPGLLRSHEEVLDAEEKDQVKITPTRIVKNCPVIFSEHSGLLAGVKLIGNVR